MWETSFPTSYCEKKTYTYEFLIKNVGLFYLFYRWTSSKQTYCLDFPNIICIILNYFLILCAWNRNFKAYISYLNEWIFKIVIWLWDSSHSSSFHQHKVWLGKPGEFKIDKNICSSQLTYISMHKSSKRILFVLSSKNSSLNHVFCVIGQLGCACYSKIINRKLWGWLRDLIMTIIKVNCS